MKLNREELKALIILLNLETKYKALDISEMQFKELLTGNNIIVKNKLNFIFTYRIKYIDNERYKQLSNIKLKEEKYYNENENFFILECEHNKPFYINSIRLSECTVKSILTRLQYNHKDIYSKIELSFKNFLDNNSIK